MRKPTAEQAEKATRKRLRLEGRGLMSADSLDQKINDSIALLRANEPADQPYYGGFSGGKDSIVIKELARLAGVNVVWHYNQTTIDPPELTRFILDVHPDVLWAKPRHGNFFRRMEKKGFPTRRARWCCEEYKETAAPRGSVMILGVRAEESPKRAKTWKDVTFHTRTRAWAVAPILRWSEEDVWAFIEARHLPYCTLYDEGFERLGCVGCPMARAAGRRKAFDRWPGFEKAWKVAFKRIWDRRHGTLQRNGKIWFGDAFFHNWEEMWDWWASDRSLPARLPTGEAEVEAVVAGAVQEALEDEEAEDEEGSCQTALDMLSGAGEDEEP